VNHAYVYATHNIMGFERSSNCLFCVSNMTLYHLSIDVLLRNGEVTLFDSNSVASMRTAGWVAGGWVAQITLLSMHNTIQSLGYLRLPNRVYPGALTMQ